MGAVSLAQRGGILGSGIYQTQKPNVDVAGAIGAISQALTAQREGVIQRAYLQHQRNREDLLDARAAIQTATENAFRQRQLEQAGELARGQHDIEQRRIDAETQTKIALAQLSHEVGMARAKATLEAAQARATGTEEAARIRGPLAGNNAEAQGAKSMAAAQKSYQAYLKQFMGPQIGPGGIKTSGMSFQAASQAAREAVRETYPDEAKQLWGAETAPGSGDAAVPTNITQGEMSANAAYTQRYRALDPKDPQYAQKKSDLDKALQAQLTQVHSQAPQPLPQPSGPPMTSVAPTGVGPTGAPSTLPSGDQSDNDQEP